MSMNKLFSDAFKICDSDHVPCNSNARGVSLDTTLSTVSNYLTEMSITRVADVTEYDRLGIPVYTATRINVSDKQISATQGKGNCHKAAKVSALMEAVERHFCRIDNGGEYKSVEELESTSSRYYLPKAIQIEQDATIKWRSAYSLYSGKELKIPVAEIAFPYKDDKDILSKLLIPSTTGVAAGNTELEAIYQAGCEMVERHFTSLFYQGHITPTRVDIENIQDSELNELVCKLSNEVELVIFDLSAASKIPLFIVLSWDDSGILPPLYIGGQGCHVDASIALKRAILECAQSRVVALQGSREDLTRHGASWHKSYSDAEKGWQQLIDYYQSVETSDYLQCKLPGNYSTVELINLMSSSLQSLGLDEFLVVDRGCTFEPFYVVNAIIPGLADTRPQHLRDIAYE